MKYNKILSLLGVVLGVLSLVFGFMQWWKRLNEIDRVTGAERVLGIQVYTYFYATPVIVVLCIVCTLWFMNYKRSK